MPGSGVAVLDTTIGRTHNNDYGKQAPIAVLRCYRSPCVPAGLPTLSACVWRVGRLLIMGSPHFHRVMCLPSWCSVASSVTPCPSAFAVVSCVSCVEHVLCYVAAFVVCVG